MNVDVEQALIAWLTAELPAVRCVTELPANLLDVLPVIDIGRIGGTDPTPGIDRATVDVSCYHVDRIKAKALAYQVQSLLRLRLAGTSVVGGVVLHVQTVSGPTFHPYQNPALRRFGATYLVSTQSRL